MIEYASSQANPCYGQTLVFHWIYMCTYTCFVPWKTYLWNWASSILHLWKYFLSPLLNLYLFKQLCSYILWSDCKIYIHIYIYMIFLFSIQRKNVKDSFSLVILKYLSTFLYTYFLKYTDFCCKIHIWLNEIMHIQYVAQCEWRIIINRKSNCQSVSLLFFLFLYCGRTLASFIQRGSKCF